MNGSTPHTRTGLVMGRNTGDLGSDCPLRAKAFILTQGAGFAVCRAAVGFDQYVGIDYHGSREHWRMPSGSLAGAVAHGRQRTHDRHASPYQGWRHAPAVTSGHAEDGKRDLAQGSSV